jgi:hypothetical protein
MIAELPASSGLERTANAALLACVLSLAATLPVYAGPGDFGNIRIGGDMNLRLSSQANFGRENKPNIPVQIPVINNDSVGRAVNIQPTISIDSMATKIMSRPDIQMSRMPVIPDMPTIITPDVSSRNVQIHPTTFTPVVSPKVSITPISAQVLNPTLQTTRGIDHAVSEPINADSRSESGAGRHDSRAASFAVAAVSPAAVNQTGAAAASAPQQNPADTVSNEVAEIKAQTYVGKGYGSVVTSNFVNDPLDVDGIEKALGQHIALFEGTTLFIPDHDLVVETKHGDVHLVSKSVVLVSSDANGLAVYDIHDHKKGAIKVTSGGKTYTLAPGRHVVISTDQSGDFAMANALELIPHTDVTRVETGETRTVFTSEFSIPAAINSVNALKSLTASKDPELQKISNKVMKTTSILLYMRSSNYKHYLRPRVTLLSQN